MAWDAEVAPQGWPLNSTMMNDYRWEQMRDRIRRGEWTLVCPDCRTRLRPRTPGRALKHFYHSDPTAPRTCRNRQHEGESPTHRTIKANVAEAWATVPGVVVDTELSLPTGDGLIRADVGVRTAGTLDPVSLAEIQISYEPTDVWWKRDNQRRELVGVDRDGYARTTPWFSNRALEGWYGVVPILYTDKAGQRVTDGVYEPYIDKWGNYGGGDVDKPVAMDIDEAVKALSTPGALAREGSQSDRFGHWVDRRRIAGRRRRGKARRQLRQRRTDLIRHSVCVREPALASSGPDTPPAKSSGAPTHILACSMAGKWTPPPTQPWDVELVGGPYNGSMFGAYKLGDTCSVVGEHGRALYGFANTNDGVHHYMFVRRI